MHTPRTALAGLTIALILTFPAEPISNLAAAQGADDTSPLDNLWYFTEYGPAVTSGTVQRDTMVVDDIDHDGRAEIFTGGEGSVSLVVRESLAGAGDYIVEGMVAMPIDGIMQSTLVADLDGDGLSEILAGTDAAYRLRVYDGSDLFALTEIGAVATAHHCTVMRFDRLTPTSDPWLYAADLASTTIIEPATLQIRHVLPWGGTDFEIGNVEGDEYTEIVYSTGKVVFYSGFGAELRYDYGWVETTPVQLVNIDADPELEIIAGFYSGGMKAFDFGNPVPVYTWPTMAHPDHVEDLIGDSQVELVARGIDGSVNFIDPQTRQVLWTYATSGTSTVAFGDTDGDGEIEMLAGSSKVVDVATQTLEWAGEHLVWGAFNEVAVGDIDGVGGLEVVFASEYGIGPDSFGGAWLFVLESETHDVLLETLVPLDGGGRLARILDVEIGDMDNDGGTDIAVMGVAQVGNNTFVVTYDGATLTKTDEIQISDCGFFSSMRIADVDGDNESELVGVGPSATCDGSQRLWVFDAASGAVEWESPSYGGTLMEVVVTNADDDPALELVFLQEEAYFPSENPDALEDHVYVVDAVSHAQQWMSPVGEYTSLAVYDLDQNGGSIDILVGTYGGQVVAYEPEIAGPGFVERLRFSLYPSPVTGIAGYQVTGGDVRLALTNYDKLIGADPFAGTIQWQSRALGLPTGHHDGLATLAIAGNTGTLFLLGGNFTVYQYGGVVEPSRPALTAATLTVAEDAGGVTVTAERLGSTAGVLEVDYATEDRTATEGSDYTGVSGTFIWADGDGNDKSVVVPILEDGTPELAETFVFNLFNVVGGAPGRPSQAWITIEDDDSSIVSFTVTGTVVDETAGTVALDVVRTGDLSSGGSVDWATAEGSALAGQDFTAATGTLGWAVGDGSPKTLQVAILDDVLFEGDETFNVVLSNPTGNAVIGEPSAATVTIDSEDVIEIGFSAAAFAAAEGDGQATITAWRTGAVNGEVTVDFTTADGTAVAGADYTTTAGTLTWTDGDSSPKTFPVPILDDGEVELDETVLLALANPTGGATLGVVDEAVLTIEDDDGTLLRFTGSSFSAAESGGSAEIWVERWGADTSGAVTVDFATADGTASAGHDYLPALGTLTWATGDSTDKSFTVTILDDGQLEGPESVNLSLSGPTGNAAIGSPADATLVITDDDGIEIQVNTETNGPQTSPDVAVNADGVAVVVWESYLQDGSGWGVYAQRFGPDGAPAGGELLVNATTAGDQREAAVAVAADGSFTVAWRGADASGQGIRGRRFDASGVPVSGEFGVNTVTTGDQSAPDIAIDGSGVAMVVWQSEAGPDLDVRGQLYDASGAPVGGELAVSTTTASDQQAVAVAGSAGGGFAVAWQSTGQEGPGEGIIARRFTSSGAPATGERVANQWTAGNQIAPTISHAGNGDFLVAWEDTTHQDGMGSSIRARWFDGAAAPLGGDIQLNTYWLNDQMKPSIAANADGDAFAVWESMGQDGFDLGVFAQAVDHDGGLHGPELPVNNFVDGPQYRAALAASESGFFWAVWASGAQDGSGDGIYGLFGEMPIATGIFADGFESGDTSAWSSTTP